MAEGSKIEVRAGDLAAAMAAIEAVVAARNTIPILSNVRLIVQGERLHLTGTDLDIMVSEQMDCVADGAFALTVDARKLGLLAKAVDSDSRFSLQIDGPAVIVRAGRSRWKLPSLPAADFPDMVFDGLTEAMEASGKKWVEIFARLRSAISTEETRYYLNGIYCHPDAGTARFAATNGHVAHVTGSDIALADTAPGVIIPRKMVDILIRMLGGVDAVVGVDFSNRIIRFAWGDTVVLAKLIDGTFPDYSRVIPAENPLSVEVDVEELKAAVKRVLLVESSKSRRIYCDFSGSGLSVSARSDEGGEGREDVACAWAADDFQICLNGTYLTDMAEAAAGDRITVHLADATAPVRVENAAGDGFVGVIMPIRA